MGRGTIGLVMAAVLLALGLVARAGETVPGPVPARVVRVIDGDTLVVRARIWLGQDVETAVRLADVDAPELRGACPRERTLAAAARELVAATVGEAPVSLLEVRRDKFGGRVLARVRTAAGADLGAVLLAARLAQPYAGGGRGDWCRSAGLAP